MKTVNIIMLILLFVLMWCKAARPHAWPVQDVFEEIREKVDKITEYNCFSADRDDLFLPKDAVSHHPGVKEIDFNPVFPNKSAMMILQNLALNRAFFWSFISQSRFNRQPADESFNTGMMYHLLSSVADLSTSSNVIKASSLYYSSIKDSSSSDRDFSNQTLSTYAPSAFRSSEPSHHKFSVKDLGVFDFVESSEDYRQDDYRINERYRLWLPDNVEKRNNITPYQVEITRDCNTTDTLTLYGPPGYNEEPGPVKWSRPYFDCGRLNKWLVAAVSPVADIYPRDTLSKQNEHPTYTAAVVVEMDFDKIDIDQCPYSQGNDGPNIFANTARCKVNTTECEPLYGRGFQRGSYQCRCRPGFHLPSTVRGPYLGEVIERVNSLIYNENFDCPETIPILRFPERGQRVSTSIRLVYMNQFSEYVNMTKGKLALEAERTNIHEVLSFIKSVKPTNCQGYEWSDLILNRDIAYGAKEQFENQAMMAVRLANFLSAFLQVSDPRRNTHADKPLTEDQMFAEALAILFGDSKIWSSAILWDRNKFPNRTFFAPFAYKTDMKSRNFKIKDLGSDDNYEELYTHKPWFELRNQRWNSNYDQFERYLLNMTIRSEERGETFRQFLQYPTYYKAAKLEHGQWTSPYFDCDGHLKKWMITYGVPFIGWDNFKAKLEFKGVVAVSMSLMSLDINQCYNKYYVLNAFKKTNKCDKESTICLPLRGHGFEAGGYRCECRQGYEYPFEGPAYFDGQLVEAEFQNMIANKETRIDMFKCRPIDANVNKTQTQDNSLKTNSSSVNTIPFFTFNPFNYF